MDIATTNPIVENALKACNEVVDRHSKPITTKHKIMCVYGKDMGKKQWVGKVTGSGVMLEDGQTISRASLGKDWEIINAATDVEPVAKNAYDYFNVGDIVTFKPFGRDVKFKVVSEYPTDNGNGQMLTVEAYKGGFKDRSVRFEKA